MLGWGKKMSCMIEEGGLLSQVMISILFGGIGFLEPGGTNKRSLAFQKLTNVR